MSIIVIQKTITCLPSWKEYNAMKCEDMVFSGVLSVKRIGDIGNYNA